MDAIKPDTHHFETNIEFPGVEILLEEIDINMLEFWQKPLLPFEAGNYTWRWDISMSTDPASEDDPYDQFTCYINGEMHMKGQEYFIIKINTLHSYRLTEQKYKKEHEELFKAVAKESCLHAKEIMITAAKGTPYEGFPLPQEDEEELNELAEFWNKRGYIPQPSEPDENAFGRKPNQQEIDAMLQRLQELVDWIDAHDETDGNLRTEEETAEYWKKYAEWAKLNKRIWHFKLIGRNFLAYNLTKIMAKLEKGLKEHPDDYLLRETYNDMSDDYVSFMNELKDEFVKN